MPQERIISRVRKWLSLGQASEAESTEPVGYDELGNTMHATVLAARRQMLDGLGAFLIEHHLPIDAETLAFAYDVSSGSDPRLPGLVNRRLREQLPLTREWIEEIRAEQTGNEMLGMNQLRERLEKSIADFTRTTRDARSATSDYRIALKNHVGELDGQNATGAVIIELANVAKAMLSRTQEIEQQMIRSERETKLLQRRLDEARRSAELDHLTGLPNRRAFEGFLASEHTEARRTNDCLCVAFCDIDKFKTINDTHGHEAGDRVLKVVARTLAEISDDRCHVARHGGEEFVVLFRGKTVHEAFETLDATREALAGRRLVNRATDTPFGQVSFSAGLAEVFAYSDPRAALKAADEALYAAKDQGRNRIVIASNAPSPAKAA